MRPDHAAKRLLTAPEAAEHPDLADLIRDPGQIVELPPGAVPRILGEIEHLRANLWARLLSLQATCAGESREEDRLLTIPEVAGRLKISKGRAYEMARRGELPKVHIGRYVRIPLPGLREWEARNMKNKLDR